MVAQSGMIGFSFNSSKTNILAKAIRFFTSSKFSHCFLVIDPVLDEPAVIEASEIVQVIPLARYFEFKDESFLLFSLPVADKAKVDSAVAAIFFYHSGMKYGYFELLWFLWSWLVKKVFGKVIKKGNPFRAGIICTEVVWHYINALGGEYAKCVSEFDPDTISPYDLEQIVKARPDLFKLEYSKGIEWK